jgi:cytochrome c551/c552
MFNLWQDQKCPERAITRDWRCKVGAVFFSTVAEMVLKLKSEILMKKLLAVGLAVTAAAALSASAADPKALYEKECTKCHGSDGKGDTKMGKKLGAKDYTDAKVQAELTDAAGIKAIKEGLKDKEGKTLMKPAEGMTDGEIKGLVDYMRTFKK